MSERVNLLREVYDELVKNKELLAHSVAREMGMPIKLARDEVGYGIGYMDWYLEHAEEALSPTVTHETETEIHTVTYEPK